MDGGLERLLGRARGYLEAQPVGSRPGYSRAAYARYAQRGMQGFARWSVDPAGASRLVRAGIRMLALERLAGSAERLAEAMSRNEATMAAEAGAEVEAALAVLSEVPRRVRGPNASRDGMDAEAVP